MLVKIQENNEYTETWYATIMLAVTNNRGGYAADLARSCNCSQTTFRKYANELIASGEMCCIRYGTPTYPDNRYYALSDATKEFCEPLQSMLEWVTGMAENANEGMLIAFHGTNEHSRRWGEHTGLWRVKRELARRIDLLNRLAVKCANS